MDQQIELNYIHALNISETLDTTFDPDIIMILKEMNLCNGWDYLTFNKFKETYISRYFYRCKGMYYEHDINGNVLGKTIYEKFLKKMEKHEDPWNNCLDKIRKYYSISTDLNSSDDPLIKSPHVQLHYDATINDRLNTEELQSISTLIFHLTQQLCSNDANNVQHLIDFLAIKFLFPFDSIKLLDQGLFVVGTGGSGKTEFFKLLFQCAFGLDQVLQCDFSEIGAKFNAQMINKLIYQIDDGGGTMKQVTYEKLKRLITNTTFTATQKYFDSAVIGNTGTVIITANELDAVRIDPKGSRQFFILSTDPMYINDPVYFSKLRSELKNNYKLFIRWILSMYSHPAENKLPSPPINDDKKQVLGSKRTSVVSYLGEDVRANPDMYHTGIKSIPFTQASVCDRIKDASGKFPKGITFKSVGDELKKFCLQIEHGDHRGRNYFKSYAVYQSFRDYLGINEPGLIKNKWIEIEHSYPWDYIGVFRSALFPIQVNWVHIDHVHAIDYLDDLPAPPAMYFPAPPAMYFPIVAVDEPIVAVDEPIVAIDEPIVAIDEPIVAIDEPIVAIDEPIVAVAVAVAVPKVGKIRIKSKVK